MKRFSFDDAFFEKHQRYLKGEITYRQLHNLDDSTQSTERRASIRAVQGSMVVCSILIVLMTVGAILTGSPAFLLAIPFNLVSIGVGYYVQRHLKRWR